MKNILWAIMGMMVSIGTVKASTTDIHIDSVSVFSVWNSSDSSDLFAVAKVHFGTNCGYNGYTVTPDQSRIIVKACYRVGNSTVVCYRNDTMYLGRYAAGSYNVNVIFNLTSGATCSGATSADTVTIDYSNVTSGIADIPEVQANMFPNPANDFLNCTVSSSERVTLHILSLDGVLLEQCQVHGQNTVIDVSRYPAGVYVAKFEGKGWAIIKKFCKIE